MAISNEQICNAKMANRIYIFMDNVMYNIKNYLIALKVNIQTIS